MQVGNPQWCWGARGARWCNAARWSRKADGQWHTGWSRSILKSHLGKIQKDNIYSFTSLKWTWDNVEFYWFEQVNRHWHLGFSMFLLSKTTSSVLGCKPFVARISQASAPLGNKFYGHWQGKRLRVQNDQPANVSDKAGSQLQPLQLCCDGSTKHAQPNTVNERVCYHLMLQFSQWSTSKSSSSSSSVSSWSSSQHSDTRLLTIIQHSVSNNAQNVKAVLTTSLSVSFLRPPLLHL